MISSTTAVTSDETVTNRFCDRPILSIAAAPSIEVDLIELVLTVKAQLAHADAAPSGIMHDVAAEIGALRHRSQRLAASGRRAVRASPLRTEVELLSVDDAIDPDERALLLQSVEDGFADIARGDHMDAFEFVAQLRAKREATHR